MKFIYKLAICHISCFSSSLPADILFRPNITVSAMQGKSDDHNVMLFKGHSFTIRCSVEPQYPGGHFSIIFTGLKRTHSHSHTQPAVNHSANFTYARADESLQGNYSCVYHNFVFNHNFSAESHRLSLTLFGRVMQLCTISAYRSNRYCTCHPHIIKSSNITSCCT